ncbi:hypothetical protein QVD17_16180 [Tagetes erecta]|uniref:Uncharacterized protein n=1 Tax=Tagetes erecta TaxID=13708 RepID=A0AAD8KRN3_TARER|nr:hypothetical protein QVD17_16180 [Tagetes erecta]
MFYGSTRSSVREQIQDLIFAKNNRFDDEPRGRRKQKVEGKERPPRKIPSFSGLLNTLESASKLKWPNNGYRKLNQEPDVRLLETRDTKGARVAQKRVMIAMINKFMVGVVLLKDNSKGHNIMWCIAGAPIRCFGSSFSSACLFY